jgi:hypothetical protein
MIEVECPLCATALLLPPAAEELACRDCAITVGLDDEDERMPMALAA